MIYTKLFTSLLFISIILISEDNYYISGAKSMPVVSKCNSEISDLVLIYHGSTHRPEWNTNELRPYVYTSGATGFHWLFDGFLFLEIFDKIRKIEWDPGFGYATADREQWEWLLERYFNDGKGPDALESILDSLATEGKKPLRKRRVLISIPCPVSGFTEWGAVDGVSLDFNSTEDQITAACWFIDRTLEKWQGNNYEHISLDGFYWVHEAAGSDFAIIPEVKKYLHEKGLKLYWIPYWNAKRSGQWDSLGFNCAYQQPNYFFSKDIPYQRLDDACNFAKLNGMGMEMEFDNNVVNPDLRNRFYDYINSFEANGVWDRMKVAYYEGGGAWFRMSQSGDQEMKRMFMTLSEIIIRRQEKADKEFMKSSR